MGILRVASALLVLVTVPLSVAAIEMAFQALNKQRANRTAHVAVEIILFALPFALVLWAWIIFTDRPVEDLAVEIAQLLDRKFKVQAEIDQIRKTMETLKEDRFDIAQLSQLSDAAAFEAIQSRLSADDAIQSRLSALEPEVVELDQIVRRLNRNTRWGRRFLRKLAKQEHEAATDKREDEAVEQPRRLESPE